MYKDWIGLVPHLIDNIDKTENLKCPNCGEHKVDYLYIGDNHSRVGYLQLWCSSCLKGIYVSRAKAPQNAKMITFNQKEELGKIIPKYTFINE